VEVDDVEFSLVTGKHCTVDGDASAVPMLTTSVKAKKTKLAASRSTIRPAESPFPRKRSADVILLAGAEIFELELSLSPDPGCST
jgi:hypothetical protein